MCYGLCYGLCGGLGSCSGLRSRSYAALADACEGYCECIEVVLFVRGAGIVAVITIYIVDH